MLLERRYLVVPTLLIVDPHALIVGRCIVVLLPVLWPAVPVVPLTTQPRRVPTCCCWPTPHCCCPALQPPQILFDVWTPPHVPVACRQRAVALTFPVYTPVPTLPVTRWDGGDVTLPRCCPTTPRRTPALRDGITSPVYTAFRLITLNYRDLFVDLPSPLHPRLR